MALCYARTHSSAQTTPTPTSTTTTTTTHCTGDCIQASDIATSEQHLVSLDTTEAAFKRSKEDLVRQINENEAELVAIADAFTEYGEDRRGVSSLQDELELHLDNIGHLKVRTHACTYARARAELLPFF